MIDPIKDLEHHEGDTTDGKPAAAGDGKKPPLDAAGAKKKKDDKTAILVVISAAGLILAYLTFRKSGSSAAATSSAPAGSSANNLGNYPAAATDGSGTVAGFSGDGGASDGFAALLQNLESQVTALQAGSVAATGTIPASTSSGTVKAGKPISSGAYYDYAAGAKVVTNKSTGTSYEVDPDSGAFYQLTYGQLVGLKQLGGVQQSSYGTTPVAKPKAKTPPLVPVTPKKPTPVKGK